MTNSVHHPRRANAVVVGAGAVGLATALSLQDLGLSVTVLDAGLIGMETSYGNGGWLSPALTTPAPAAPGMPTMAMRETFQRTKAVSLRPLPTPDFISWTARLLWNCRRGPYERNCRYLSVLSAPMWETFDELADRGASFEMHSVGNLRACFTTAQAAHQLEELAPMRRAGFNIPTEVLGPAEIHELEPALSSEVRSGFLLPDERHVNPMSFTAALAKLLREGGGDIREGAAARSFEVGGDGSVRGVKTDGGTVAADLVVVAAGMWTRPLLRQVGAHLPLRAGKGYSFYVDLPTPPRRPVYMSDSKVGLSPIGGRVRIAGGMDVFRDDLRPNRRLVRGMVETARHFLADWPADFADTAVAESWVGMRPMTPDGLPVIDAVPSVPNLYVNTGHGMTGVGLSLVCGRHLATFATSGQRPDEIGPFRLSRFRRRAA